RTFERRLARTSLAAASSSRRSCFARRTEFNHGLFAHGTSAALSEYRLTSSGDTSQGRKAQAQMQGRIVAGDIGRYGLLGDAMIAGLWLAHLHWHGTVSAIRVAAVAAVARRADPPP